MRRAAENLNAKMTFDNDQKRPFWSLTFCFVLLRVMASTLPPRRAGGEQWWRAMANYLHELCSAIYAGGTLVRSSRI